MTHKERVLASLERKNTDRMPLRIERRFGVEAQNQRQERIF